MTCCARARARSGPSHFTCPFSPAPSFQYNPSPLARRVATQRRLALGRNFAVAGDLIRGVAQRIRKAKHARKKRKATQPHYQALCARGGQEGGGGSDDGGERRARKRGARRGSAGTGERRGSAARECGAGRASVAHLPPGNMRRVEIKRRLGRHAVVPDHLVLLVQLAGRGRGRQCGEKVKGKRRPLLGRSTRQDDEETRRGRAAPPQRPRTSPVDLGRRAYGGSKVAGPWWPSPLNHRADAAPLVAAGGSCATGARARRSARPALMAHGRSISRGVSTRGGGGQNN